MDVVANSVSDVLLDRAIYQLARWRFSRGEYEQALADYRALLEKFPDSDDAHMARMAVPGVLFRLQRYAEAADAYLGVVRDVPFYAPMAENERAWCLFLGDRPEDGLSELKRLAGDTSRDSSKEKAVWTPDEGRAAARREVTLILIATEGISAATAWLGEDDEDIPIWLSLLGRHDEAAERYIIQNDPIMAEYEWIAAGTWEPVLERLVAGGPILPTDRSRSVIAARIAEAAHEGKAPINAGEAACALLTPERSTWWGATSCAHVLLAANRPEDALDFLNHLFEGKYGPVDWAGEAARMRIEAGRRLWAREHSWEAARIIIEGSKWLVDGACPLNITAAKDEALAAVEGLVADSRAAHETCLALRVRTAAGRRFGR